jgi:endogenous inhibitor of DNA gyrase (YacG/DUF329 family)
MRPLNATELLLVWERGQNQSPLERALALLAASCPERDVGTIAVWPIGERDDRLMQLREWMFGPQLSSTADCPRCGEKVEWESRLDDFRRQDPEAPPAATLELNTDGYALHFRLPNSQDVAAVLQEPGEAARQGLLNRCILSARQEDRTCEIPELPPAVLAKLAKMIEDLDPQADIRMALNCPQCGHSWNLQFDICSYLWTEIELWAQQTLNAVHRLARAYGWSERDILELSPVRRQLYLGLIHS